MHGWVASPEFTLPNARGLYTLVNRRYIRDRGVNHAWRNDGPVPAVTAIVTLPAHAIGQGRNV